ncbi:MAG: roadblock/LC7 domain-containing protein [candidate division NC10 bacterium]
MRSIASLVIYEEDLSRINTCLSSLQHKARSSAVLLIDTSGQLIATAGGSEALDTTPLASLAAGSIAAAGALAQLLGEQEFSFVFYDGERKRLHLSVIGHQAILLVLLDRHSAIPLVRLQVKKFSKELERIFNELDNRPEPVGGRGREIGEITDDDVETLFEMS